MSLSIKHSITSILNELNNFTQNDILVNVLSEKVINLDKMSDEDSFILQNLPELNIIVQKTETYYRESGIKAICLADGILELNYKGKIVQSPIFITPLVYQKNSILNEFTFEKLGDAQFINPFVQKYLLNQYNLVIPDIDLFQNKLELFQNWLHSIQLDIQVKKEQYLGNFHYHRFHIIKDLEELSTANTLNQNVAQIVGNEEQKTEFKLPLTKKILFPSDNNHLQVFKTIANENCVIQGPPGTGKSQVLSNVIGKSLYDSKATLVISEKRVALEVLQKKLATYQLDSFLFITTSETVSQDFLKSLEKTWYEIENYIPKNIQSIQLSEQYKDYLQLQLDLLSKKELIGGVTFDEFQHLAKKIDFDTVNYLSDVPKITDWQTYYSIIQRLYDSKCHYLLPYFKFSFVCSPAFENLDIIAREWHKIIVKLHAVFQINTLEDLDFAIKKASVCQLITNESQKFYFPILIPNSREQKKYYSLKKKYIKCLQSLSRLENEQLNWKEFPSANEVNILLAQLQKGSFFQKRKAKKRISKLAKSSFIHQEEALINWKAYLEISTQLTILQFEFKEIGCTDLELDFSLIDLLLMQIKENDWQIYFNLTVEERDLFNQYHSDLGKLKSIFKSYFSISEQENIHPIFEQITIHFEDAKLQLQNIQSLPESLFKLLSKAPDYSSFEKLIFKGNWVQFERYFPELAKFKPEQIGFKIQEILNCENEEYQQFATEIRQRVFHKFQEYHRILQTSTVKLTTEEKNLKKQLKKGKSILVKEFAKTRSHPTIRELLQTEATVWIQLLKPIWLSNPVQVSKCFPLNPNLFDLVIFDEASQIPLAHALGSIQRAKRIIIAGDEQQMSPSNFFKTGNSEIVDLLHQAGFYWKTVSLQHHYRSQFPELIEFSNKHFYNHSLITYPSANAVKYPIQRHYCSKGIFEENQNKEEAKKIALLITEKIQFENPSIGIVAFSQTQLNCIWNHLDNNTQNKLQDLIDLNLAFFKSLENVQGEECDFLFISLGYAKNETGDFHMRFGPINQKTGTKRLNVLLTRAKVSIDFVCSVQSTDFKLTTNESIRLLQLFLQQIENPKAQILNAFPHQLTPSINYTTKTSTFTSITNTLNNVNELVTLQRVLQNRGWNVKYN